VLEINQAGLSWLVVLKKRQGFIKAYDDCNIHTIATYTQEDKERLRNDNLRRSEQAQNQGGNAQRILELQKKSWFF